MVDKVNYFDFMQYNIFYIIIFTKFHKLNKY